MSPAGPALRAGPASPQPPGSDPLRREQEAPREEAGAELGGQGRGEDAVPPPAAPPTPGLRPRGAPPPRPRPAPRARPQGLPAPARLLPRRRPSSPAVPASRPQPGRSSPLPSSVPHLPLLHLPLLPALRPRSPGAARPGSRPLLVPDPTPVSPSPRRRPWERGARREGGGAGDRESSGGGKREGSEGGRAGEGRGERRGPSHCPTGTGAPPRPPRPPAAERRAPGAEPGGRPGGEGGALRGAARSWVRREPRACRRRGGGEGTGTSGSGGGSGREGRDWEPGPFGPHCCSDWKPKTGGAARGERRPWAVFKRQRQAPAEGRSPHHFWVPRGHRCSPAEEPPAAREQRSRARGPGPCAGLGRGTGVGWAREGRGTKPCAAHQRRGLKLHVFHNQHFVRTRPCAALKPSIMSPNSIRTTVRATRGPAVTGREMEKRKL